MTVCSCLVTASRAVPGMIRQLTVAAACCGARIARARAISEGAAAPACALAQKADAIDMNSQRCNI